MFSRYYLRTTIYLILVLLVFTPMACERLNYFDRVIKFSNLTFFVVSVHDAYVENEFTDIGDLPILDHGHCWVPEAEGTPTVQHACTHLGTIDEPGSFGSDLHELGSNSTYQVRAYAITKEDTIYDKLTTITTWGVIDWEGNGYPTVIIGEQEWMAVNLRTRYYETGADLVDGNNTGNIEYDFTTRYFFTQELEEELVGVYGRLYTWAAVMEGAPSSEANPSGVQGVCPADWHVPSDEEWMQLEIYLGMDMVAAEQLLDRGTDQGGQLKSTEYFWEPNTGATNETGFTAVPGGDHNPYGGFAFPGGFAAYWTSTQADAETAFMRGLDYDKATVNRWNHMKHYGFSVRCVKD